MKCSLLCGVAIGLVAGALVMNNCKCARNIVCDTQDMVIDKLSYAKRDVVKKTNNIKEDIKENFNFDNDNDTIKS